MAPPPEVFGALCLCLAGGTSQGPECSVPSAPWGGGGDTPHSSLRPFGQPGPGTAPPRCWVPPCLGAGGSGLLPAWWLLAGGSSVPLPCPRPGSLWPAPRPGSKATVPGQYTGTAWAELAGAFLPRPALPPPLLGEGGSGPRPWRGLTGRGHCNRQPLSGWSSPQPQEQPCLRGFLFPREVGVFSLVSWGQRQ